MTIRFYAACLASYNNGVLHGAWIDASADVDDMAAEVATMLRESPFPNVRVECIACEGDTSDESPCVACRNVGTVPSAEEWAVHDSEGLAPGMGEYPGLAAIAAWCELVDAADDRGIDLDLAQEVASHYGEPDRKGQFSETLDAINDKYLGAHDSLEAYAAETVEESGMLEGVSDEVRRYFDFKSYGRDLELGGDVFTIWHGGAYHVFSGH